MRRPVLLPFGALLLLAPSFASAHDVWIEPSASVVRAGDWLSLSLMLGNHGNEHRDFKVAGKVAAGDQSLAVIGPDAKRLDLTPSLVDTGYAPQEGYWTTRFQPSKPGLYTAVSRFDKVMGYAPVRDVKCAKACFLVSKSLDRVSRSTPGFDRPVGAPFELVPLTNPVVPMGPGEALRVRVLYRGKPMAGVRVGFVPRGAEAKGGLDPAYEKTTGADGTVRMTLREANAYLVAAHWTDQEAKGEGYASVHYSATLFVIVPGVCPCC